MDQCAFNRAEFGLTTEVNHIETPVNQIQFVMFPEPLPALGIDLSRTEIAGQLTPVAALPGTEESLAHIDVFHIRTGCVGVGNDIHSTTTFVKIGPVGIMIPIQMAGDVEELIDISQRGYKVGTFLLYTT